MRQNAYWIDFVDQAQSEGERLDRVRKRASIIAAVTPATSRRWPGYI